MAKVFTQRRSSHMAMACCMAKEPPCGEGATCSFETTE